MMFDSKGFEELSTGVAEAPWPNDNGMQLHHKGLKPLVAEGWKNLAQLE